MSLWLNNFLGGTVDGKNPTDSIFDLPLLAVTLNHWFPLYTLMVICFVEINVMHVWIQVIFTTFELSYFVELNAHSNIKLFG